MSERVVISGPVECWRTRGLVALRDQRAAVAIPGHRGLFVLRLLEVGQWMYRASFQSVEIVSNRRTT